MRREGLKAITAYRLTTNTEDSDVRIYNDEFECGGDAVEVYPRAEADEYINSLEDKIEALERKNQQWHEGAVTLRKKLYRMRAIMYKACANWALAEFRILDHVDQGEPAKWHEMWRKCLDKARQIKEGI